MSDFSTWRDETSLDRVLSEDHLCSESGYRSLSATITMEVLEVGKTAYRTGSGEEK
jgi:hypothetical protein